MNDEALRFDGCAQKGNVHLFIVQAFERLLPETLVQRQRHPRNGIEEGHERVERLKQMTPDKIAPLAVYLCSDRADGITGQIIGVRNNEIFLYSQPRPIRVLHRSDGWTVEKLDGQLKNAFRQSLTPLERSGDVLNWDPV